MLADDVAQAGHGNLIDRRSAIDNIDDRASRIRDAIPERGIHANRDTVFRDRLLLLDRHGGSANIDPALPLKKRDDPVEAGTARGLISAQTKYNTTLILLRDTKSRECQRKQSNHYKNKNIHSRLLSERSP